MTTAAQPVYLTLEEVAELLRVPARTLYYWRQTGAGPQAYRVGRFLRYRAREVEAWVDSQAAAPPQALRARSA